MSVARPARSLVGRCIASSTRPRSPVPVPAASCHQFHSSAPRSAKRRSQFRNIKASELGLTKPDNMKKYQEEKFPDYTPEEMELLKKKYTPEQLTALEAGEKAIDPQDMIRQGRLRDDMFRPEYIEDYATLDPRYDLRPEIEGVAEDPYFPTREQFQKDYYQKVTRLAEKTSSDHLSRAMVRALRKVKLSQGEDMIDLTEEELTDMEKDPELLQKYLAEEGQKPQDEVELDPKTNQDEFLTRAKAMKLDELVNEAWKKEIDQITASDNYPYLRPPKLGLTEDGPDGIIRAHSAEQPDLGKIPGVEGLFKSVEQDSAEDEDGRYTELRRITNLSVEEIKSMVTRVLVVRSVHNQTRLGKVRSLSCMAMAGNGNGRLGIGQAKSTESQTAMITATILAIRNMKPIRRYEDRTIYGNVTGKVGGTVVNLQSRPPGFGLRVPWRVFEMCRAVGLHDLAINMPRSKNPMNSVKATYQAFLNQPDPEEIAIGRGKKMVDVRKVYYGGATM